jgi:hypothetical protein
MAGPRRDILLDSNGNRVLVAGDYGFADGIQAVKQGIECRLKLQRGEVWLDESDGVDYRGVVLVANPRPVVIKAELGRPIAATPDVTNVVAADLVRLPNRAASIIYTAHSTAGTTSGTVTTP